MGMNCAEIPSIWVILQLKVSFKMGLFSDTGHTHPGIVILESPPGIEIQSVRHMEVVGKV